MINIMSRGISKITKKWVYGFYVYYENKSWIIPYGTNEYIEIVPKTFGRNTNISDNRKRDIYSGDIVEFKPPYCGEERKGTIIWDTEWLMWRLIVKSEDLIEQLPFGEIWQNNIIRVIGNKYDNPELLKNGYEPINCMCSVRQEDKMNKKEFQTKCIYDHFNNQLSGMVKRHEEEMQELLKDLRDKMEVLNED